MHTVLHRTIPKAWVCMWAETLSHCRWLTVFNNLWLSFLHLLLIKMFCFYTLNFLSPWQSHSYTCALNCQPRQLLLLITSHPALRQVQDMDRINTHRIRQSFIQGEKGGRKNAPKVIAPHPCLAMQGKQPRSKLCARTKLFIISD